uniref:Uncharacterized protein n=1 Tax=viral metagenome TaxID=1070528 RepID=A0A6H1ZDL1_9ZZZZ
MELKIIVQNDENGNVFIKDQQSIENLFGAPRDDIFRDRLWLSNTVFLIWNPVKFQWEFESIDDRI